MMAVSSSSISSRENLIWREPRRFLLSSETFPNSRKTLMGYGIGDDHGLMLTEHSSKKPEVATTESKEELTLMVNILSSTTRWSSESNDLQRIVAVAPPDRNHPQDGLCNQSKNATVLKEKTELDQEGRPAGTVVLYRRCSDHPQERTVLHLLINRSRTVVSQQIGNCE